MTNCLPTLRSTDTDALKVQLSGGSNHAVFERSAAITHVFPHCVGYKYIIHIYIVYIYKDKLRREC